MPGSRHRPRHFPRHTTLAVLGCTTTLYSDDAINYFSCGQNAPNLRFRTIATFQI